MPRVRDREKDRIAARKRYAKNPEKYQAQNRASWARNNEKRKEYHHANREKRNAQSREYHQSHRDEIRDRQRSYRKIKHVEIRKRELRYSKENKSKRHALWSARKCAKMQRTPNWLTAEHKNEIQRFYEGARFLTELYGTPYHVDHIVPLRGRTVSGLHVPWNLQILSAKENMRKLNTFEERTSMISKEQTDKLAAAGWVQVSDEVPGTHVGPAYKKNGIYVTFYKPNQIHFTAAISGTMVLLQIGPFVFPGDDQTFQKFEGQMLMAKMGAEMMIGGAQ